MYKKLLIAMSVLALAACQKNKLVQSNPGNAISFQAVTNYAKTGTRAAAAADPNSAPTITNEINSMNLKSFNVTFFGGKEGKSQVNYQDLEVDAPSMDNAATGANGNTTPSVTPWVNKDNATFYWPQPAKTTKVSFYAYAPTSIKSMAKIAKGNSSQTIASFTPATNAPDQVDLMVASKQTAEIPIVPMYFSHALSEVVVNARCDNPNYQVKVLGVKFVGLKAKTGTFTYPALSDTYTGTTDGAILDASVWNLTNENDNNLTYYSVGTSGNTSAITLDGNKVVTPSTATFERVMGQANSNFFILPQTGTGATFQTVNQEKVLQDDGAYIGLLVQILQKNSDGTTSQYFPAATGKFGYSCVPLSTVTATSQTATYDFLPGHKYIFNITFFKNGAGYHQPTTTPGDDKDPNKNQKDPNEPSNDDKGTPIASYPIIFAAKVTAWQTDNTDTINIDL